MESGRSSSLFRQSRRGVRNPKTNVPGKKGKGQASRIVFERKDGVKGVYAHLQNIQVKKGDSVQPADTVASVGNNGYACMPHVQIGAWKGKEPLQIIFDLEAMGSRLKAK